MHSSNTPICKDLVLLGGGHSHAIVIRMLGMAPPPPGVRITLISDVSLTPYSGMLPGHIAGIYSFQESHIDLRRLAVFANVNFVHAEATGIDTKKKLVRLKDHCSVNYDVLSIDIGSHPAVEGVAGADEFAVPAKPVPVLLRAWEALVDREISETGPLQVVVVGGGAGGVELSLRMQARLREGIQVYLVHQEDEILQTHNRGVRRKMMKALKRAGVELHLGQSVCRVKPEGVELESGRSLVADQVFWVTHASAPDWVKETELSVDPAGFILVSETLQSISHPEVFAAGDIATMRSAPRPKSGVFAVRQGKPLYRNLIAFLKGEKLRSYRPQKRFLSLIGTGDGSAVASRGSFSLDSLWMWRLKDWIDRRFMRRFEDLPEMSAAGPEPDTGPAGSSEFRDLIAHAEMRCLGCAAKVGGSILTKGLQRIREEDGAHRAGDVLVGMAEAEDAAVLAIPPNSALVQSVDYFPSPVSDPYLLGKIIVNHSFSDIFAMGAEPQSAQALLIVPYAARAKMEEMIYQVLSGVVEGLDSLGAVLVGGHTAEGDTLAAGLVANGTLVPDGLLRKGGLLEGTKLILTKPLGTGTLFAAHMRLQANGNWIEQALDSMLVSNSLAAQLLREHGAVACTDVTGFGLFGHLMEMVRASRKSVSIQLGAVPILEGAFDTAAEGLLSSLDPDNRTDVALSVAEEAVRKTPRYSLLFDPQTSGGLLAALPAGEADGCLEGLRQQGYPNAAIVGEVSGHYDPDHPITLI